MAKSNKSKSKLTWTEEQLKEYQDRRSRAGDDALKAALDVFKSESKTSHALEKKTSSKKSKLNKLEKKASEITSDGVIVKKKRKGISLKPIMESLREPQMRVSASSDDFSVWFDGARVLTVNELIALYQYRKYETFAYKVRWKNLIQRAVDELLLTQKPPYFSEKTRLVLYRRGKRLVDLDSLPTVFKYAIDGLKKAGLISEDNPNVIVEVIPIQEKGLPAIGLRLEYLPHWKAPEKDWEKDWLSKDLLEF